MATMNCLAVSPLFCRDYFACRDDFLELIESAGQVQGALHWPLPVGFQGKKLSCDAVRFGDENAGRVLVLISGTHGVEGYCGSAVQRFLLKQLAQQQVKLPAGVAVVMLHALNPWGMLWARRCDHQGIDLNRNFTDFVDLPEPHPDYAEVLARLVLSDPEQRRHGLAGLVEQWGQRYFDEVFSGGQYQYTWAPFYGGSGPSFASRIIDEVIEVWQLAGREILVIDLHSGLGPFGYGELISDHPEGSHGNRFARELFGGSVAVTASNESFSVSKQGLLDYRWHPLMQESGCFLTLEFGTYPTEKLFNTVLDDHILWRNHPSPDFADEAFEQHRRAMLEHFFPDDLLWQQAVIFRAWQLFVHALGNWSEPQHAN